MLLQVGSCIFENGFAVDYYMNGDGVSKTTSLCPCPLFMMRSGFETKKAMFESRVREKTLQFADASGSVRDVHLSLPFGCFRKEAFYALKARPDSEQGEVLCSRTFLPGEKENSKKTSTGKSLLQVGGTCLINVKEQADVKETADQLICCSVPKHCSHLLK